MVEFQTIQEAAEYVARDFVQTMIDEGFETFQEMSRCYMWDTEDIKQEVYYILQPTNCLMWDDGSTVELRDECISWRAFSKLFRDYIVKLSSSR